MIDITSLLFVLLNKNIIYYGYTKGYNRKTKTKFFINNSLAKKYFIRLVDKWQNWSLTNKNFLQPIMLFNDFYTLSFPVIEYKTEKGLDDSYFLTLLANKKVLFHVITDLKKLEEKINEIKCYVASNKIYFRKYPRSSPILDSPLN